MDTLDKAKHCFDKSCNQLDYLPTKCPACHEHFCSAHFKFEAHNCIPAKQLDYKIPVCDLCQTPVEFKRGKDLDLCLAEHMAKCQVNDETNKTKKTMKKCSHKGCRSKEVFRFECDKCRDQFCVRHRMPEVHLCDVSKNTCGRQMPEVNAKRLQWLTRV